MRVPHAVGNVLLVGARDGRLLLQHAIGCDGATPRSALTLFDPATRTERRLVVLPRDEAFAAVLPYGEPRPPGTDPPAAPYRVATTATSRGRSSADGSF